MMHLYANRRRWVNLARESFFPAKLNAFPVFSFETSGRLFLRAIPRPYASRNGIESRRRFHDFPSARPRHVSPMKSAVFPRTRVYLFATRSTFDPLKRDPYGTRKHRLASPFDPRDRIDCSRWIFRATRYRRSRGFHTNPTMGTATVRGYDFPTTRRNKLKSRGRLRSRNLRRESNPRGSDVLTSSAHAALFLSCETMKNLRDVYRWR